MQTFNIDQLITNVVLPKDGVMLMESYGTDTHSLVEYKLERALLNPRSDYEFQFRVLANLANKAKIPAFACFYRREDYAQYVVPLNEKARRITDYTEKWLTEQQWVWFQHKIRGINVTMDEFMHLNQTKPEDSAA